MHIKIICLIINDIKFIIRYIFLPALQFYCIRHIISENVPKYGNPEMESRFPDIRIPKKSIILFWGNFMLWFHWIRICNIEIHSQGFMVGILRHPLSFDFPNLTTFFLCAGGNVLWGKVLSLPQLPLSLPPLKNKSSSNFCMKISPQK